MSKTVDLFAALAPLFADMDVVNAAKAQEWAAKKTEALRAYKASDEFKNSRDAWKTYPTMFAICGGKTWYQVFNGSDKGRIAFMEKNSAATAEKRNAKIARKLADVGVVSIESADVTHNRDGFNGVYKVMTNAGPKLISIDSIYAGGWNIQCFHIRVLVKISK